MRSIRRTLLWRLFGGALVLLLLGAGLLCAGAGWLMTDLFDGTLRTRLKTFVSLIDEEGYDIEIGIDDQTMPEYFPGSAETEYFQVWLLDGHEPMFRSPSLGEADLPLRFGSEEEPAIFDADLPDGRAGRAIGADFVVPNYEPDGEDDPGPAHVILVLARGREGLDRALAGLFGGALTGILALLVVGILVGRSAVRRGLAPLEDLARHVGTVDDPVRSPRFPSEGVPEELAPLVESHNEMLERIRRAFERERRTTANIAHELRTPVAELVILSEAIERWSDDPGESSRKLAELREIGGQMSALISTLLELARMESGQVPLEIEPVDLAEIVRDSWGPFSAASQAKGLRFPLPEGSGPLVQADRVALSILLANLLSNAVEHAPRGGEIGCELGNSGGRGFLVLSNASNGLKPEDLDKLTEPLWRLSRSRDDRSHVGLGLSLVARLAALLELELSFRIEAGVFRAEVGFDASPAG